MSRAAALRVVRTDHHDGFDPVAHLVVVSELEARPADRAYRGVACLVEVRCERLPAPMVSRPGPLPSGRGWSFEVKGTASAPMSRRAS